MQVEAILSADLVPLDPPGGRWRRWEFKNWNRHAGILQAVGGAVGTPAAFRDEVREAVAKSFRVSWLRGLAFGVVVEASGPPPDAAALAEGIDARDNRRGVWQWVVVACPEAKAVSAAHTWMQVRLTPIYEALLAHYQERGLDVSRAVRGKDGLVKFLTTVARLRGVRFPEHRPPES